MPNTLIPIQTYTLSATASSVIFSNIPQNYTDLKIVVSARCGRDSYADDLRITINGNTSATYANRRLYGTGSSVGSDGGSASGMTYTYSGLGTATTATANTYSNTQFYFINYTSNSTKVWSSDGTAENNSSSMQLGITSNSCSDTNSITSITIDAYNTPRTLLAGSTFTLYGISNGVKATGGTLTVAGGYAYHTFTSTGSFLPSQKITGAEVLTIAGGAGGGGNRGGGGGAGGLLYSSGQTLNAGNSYTALVGSGGAGSAANNGLGSNGANSVFGSSIAIGGGGGGGGDASTIANNYGQAGGSGGGGANNGLGSGTISGGTGTVGQGNNGGLFNINNSSVGAGGGGAGAVGTNGDDALTNRGNGGLGSSLYTVWGSVTSTGQNVGETFYYAGGGGGGSAADGVLPAGGFGGGGKGASRSSDNGTAGTANTGGGGGGGSTGSVARVGYAGGSGIIIVRYPLS
jgi:hypothetical protein